MDNLNADFLDPWWHMYRLEDGGEIQIEEGESDPKEMPEWTKANPKDLDDAFKKHLQEQSV